MRYVGLVMAFVLALGFGWRMMGRLEAWMDSTSFQADDEPTKARTAR